MKRLGPHVWRLIVQILMVPVMIIEGAGVDKVA